MPGVSDKQQGDDPAASSTGSEDGNTSMDSSDADEMKIDKSNILLLGPTGSGIVKSSVSVTTVYSLLVFAILQVYLVAPDHLKVRKLVLL